MEMLFNNTPIAITAIVFWAVVIIVSIIVEVETAELVSIWFGIGAIPSLILAIFEQNIGIQFAVFAVVSVILILLTKPLVKRFNQKNTIPTNSDRLIGMTAKVLKEIPIDGKGLIKIDYQEWSAISKTNTVIPVDTEVVVVEITGNKLVVEPVTEIEVN